MWHLLSFEVLHDYDPGLDGITVPVVLSNSTGRKKVLAKLDTGSTFCIFQREHGEELGFDIESGILEWIGAGVSAFKAYGHEVSITALGYQLDTIVYFAAPFDFPRNVLGRRGWIEIFRLGIVEYDKKLYVSRYDDP